MENKFGKEFMKTIERQKDEFNEYNKKLKEAEAFESKVRKKENEIKFVYIHDDYTIYPNEHCRSCCYNCAKEIVEQNLNKEDEAKLITKMEIECLDN